MDAKDFMNKEPQPKKAYLVQLVLTTRIVADSSIDKSTDEGCIKLTEMGIEKIKQNIDDYLCLDNLENIYNDVDCPYNPETDEKQN